MRDISGYSIGVLVSTVIHVVVVAALVGSWQSDTVQVMVQPQYIEAQLVELAPTKKPQVKAPVHAKPDNAKKQREQEKRRAAQKKKAEAKRLAALKEKQAKEQEEKRRREAEEQRRRIETELEQALIKEQAQISAREDERVANSYLQLIRQRLADNWNRPPSARRDMETLIEIRLVPTGRIVGVNLLRSSGDIAFDRSVEQAAFKAEQFEELQQLEPRLFEKHFRTVKVAFSPQDLRL
ncbi:MAG: energy transducer TonB [Porticoccaceae bacterium]